MRALVASALCVFFLSSTFALAAPAKKVKAPSDRDCVEVEGKLTCTPRKTKHRAQNMATPAVSKSDQAGSNADTAADGAKATE